MKAFQAHNIGFGLPSCPYFKVELISKNGPSKTFKIGADIETDAQSLAIELAADWLKANSGLKAIRSRNCGQFQAV